MYKCKVYELLYKNVLNLEQSVSKLHFVVKQDSKASSPIWDFSGNQIFLVIEKNTTSIGTLDGGKANEKSSNFRMFLLGIFFVSKNFKFQSHFYRDLMLIVSIFLFLLNSSKYSIY